MELKVDQQTIKKLRLRKSWSQEELAEHAQVSLRTVQRMELDGSASLKSRRAVADALDVKPACLDPQVAHESSSEAEQATKTTKSQSRMSLFSYPGPTSMPNKVRTPLLVTLWLAMMITGGLLLLIAITLTVLGIVNPSHVFAQMLLATLPLFIVFVICLGLYGFFKRFSSTS